MKVIKFLDLINQCSASIKDSTHNHTHFKTLRQAYWYIATELCEQRLILPRLTAYHIKSLISGTRSIFYEIEMREVDPMDISLTEAKQHFVLALKTLGYMSKHNTSRLFKPSLIKNGRTICADVFKRSRTDFRWEHPEDPETGDWEEVTGNDLFVWQLLLTIQLGTLVVHKMQRLVRMVNDYDPACSMYMSVYKLVVGLENALKVALWIKED